jgi:hypothetical protein
MIQILVLVTIVASSFACGVILYIGFICCSNPIPDSKNEKR